VGLGVAGHADFKTTERYIDLAGVVFSTSVELLSARFGAGMDLNSGSKVASLGTEGGLGSRAEPEAA